MCKTSILREVNNAELVHKLHSNKMLIGERQTLKIHSQFYITKTNIKPTSKVQKNKNSENWKKKSDGGQ